MSDEVTADKPEFWTRDKKIEHTNKITAHQLCIGAKFDEARAFCEAWKLPFPPFRKSPTNQVELDVLIAKKQIRAQVAQVNGLKGGRPPGSETKNKITMATPKDTDKLIDFVAEAMLQGKEPIKSNPNFAALTPNDRTAIARLAHISADEFNRRLADKLGSLADKIADRMLQKLDEDKFKPGELAFPLAVTLDKRANLEGRNQLAGANIAVQVNNYGGSKTREQLIRSLKGNPDDDALPVDVTPPKP